MAKSKRRPHNRLQTTMRIRPELIAGLDALGRKRDRSRTWLVETAVVEYLKANGQEVKEAQVAELLE